MTAETHDYLAEARALYKQAVEMKRAEIAEAMADPRSDRSVYWQAIHVELAELLLRMDAFDDWERQRAVQRDQDRMLQEDMALRRELQAQVVRQTIAEESIAESLRILTGDQTRDLPNVPPRPEAKQVSLKRCPSTVTLRDEEHRLVRCSLPEGHVGSHTDQGGVSWTDGSQR